MRGDLAEWVSYLKDIGVRDLSVPRRTTRPKLKDALGSKAAAPGPSRRSVGATGGAASGKTAAARTAAAPKSKQRAMLVEEAQPFTEPPPADPVAALKDIRKQMGECTRCKLHDGRTNIVFGVGNPRAKILFVGEGPGENEDLQGEPFVGRAGKKLDEMIAAIGLQRADVYIANIVKCRPPGNRAPERDEVVTCSPFLVAQISAIRPNVIVSLGGSATLTLLATKVGITRLRGTWQSYRGIPVMPTFHPAYVLRNYTIQTRKQVWEDLKAAKTKAEEAPDPRS